MKLLIKNMLFLIDRENVIRYNRSCSHLREQLNIDFSELRRITQEAEEAPLLRV